MAEATATKMCARCKQPVPLSQFYKRQKAADGLGHSCKACLRERRGQLRTMTAADKDAALKALRSRPEKHCGKCGLTKPRSAFSVRSRSRDGMAPWCKNCVSEYGSTYYESHRADVLARSAARHAANKDERNRRALSWYYDNPVTARRNAAAWREANRDYMRDFASRRRAVIVGTATGDVDLDALWTGECGICRDVMDREIAFPDPMSKSIDHITPLAKGGTHTQDNLQWAHLRCNMRKGVRLTA